MPCDAALFDWAVPANVTFEVGSEALLGGNSAELIGLLQTRQPSLSLVFDEQAKAALSTGVPFRFIGFDAQRYTPAQLKVLAVQTQPFGIEWRSMSMTDNCFSPALTLESMRRPAGFSNIRHKRRPKRSIRGRRKSIRVLNLVRKNADVKEISQHSSRMWHCRTSSCATSIQRASACPARFVFPPCGDHLGYLEKLNKWLSLLLATASKDPMAPALLHTALTARTTDGRLSHGLVDRQEYDNLFITGAFSMLDVLLGVSMESVRTNR